MDHIKHFGLVHLHDNLRSTEKPRKHNWWPALGVLLCMVSGAVVLVGIAIVLGWGS